MKARRSLWLFCFLIPIKFGLTGILIDIANPFGKPYREDVSSMLKALQKQGIKKIGGRDIEELQKITSETKWYRTKEELNAGIDGDRQSGATFVEQNKVLLGEPFMKAQDTKKTLSPAGQEILRRATLIFELHEAMGANGTMDIDYDVSISAAYLGFLSNEVVNWNVRKVFQRHLDKSITYNRNIVNKNYKAPLIAKNGDGRGGSDVRGGSGVGGGGDIAAADVKFHLVTGFVNRMNEAKFTGLFPKSPEEVVEEFLNLKVKINYKEAGFNFGKNAAGKYSLTLFHDDWYYAPNAQKASYRMNMLLILLYTMGEMNYEAVNQAAE